MSGELVRDARNGPLCPFSFGVVPSPTHQLKVSLENTRYHVWAPFRDEDGELPEDLDRAEGEMYEALNDRMRLYYASDLGSLGGRVIHVETFYWMCLVCGCTLPAYEVKR